MVKVIVIEIPPTLQPALTGLIRDPYFRGGNAKPDTYIDIFIHNFPGLAQEPAKQRRQLWKTLFHTLEKVFWPHDASNPTTQKEVLRLNILLEGD